MNILGTEYQLIESDDIIKQNADGVCMEYDKQIKIRPVENMLNPDDSKLTKKKRYNEVLRHEVIHAFFSESGLDYYSSDERLIDWIAIQFPKLVELFSEQGCLK